MAQNISFYDYTVSLQNIIYITINGKKYYAENYKKTYLKNDRTQVFYNLIINNIENITYCLSKGFKNNYHEEINWYYPYRSINSRIEYRKIIDNNMDNTANYLELHLKNKKLHNLIGPAMISKNYVKYAINGNLIQESLFDKHELVIKERRIIKLNRIIYD